MFRSHILKQRFLVPRISSTVVYYVHSHLQYTFSPSVSQAIKKFDLLESEVLRHYDQNTNQQLTYKNTKSEYKHKNCFHQEHQPNSQGKAVFISQPWKSQLVLDAVTLKSPDPFINQTQLAILSLSYDKKWCKSFNTVYQKALDSRMLLEGRQGKISLVADQENCIQVKKDNANLTMNRYELKESSISQDHRAALNTVMFTSYCKNYKQTEKKSGTKDKCDPLDLATVFQTLSNEIPLFFDKGHGYGLYHKNVTFVNGLIGTSFSGLRAYKSVMTSMRIACQMCMSDLTMEILKITKDSKDCSVKVRWRVSGTPRFGRLRNKTKQVSDNRYVDGFSVFEVGHDGFIHCHRLLKLMPSQSREPNNPLWALNTAAVISLLRQQRSFEMLARHRVEDIEENISMFGAN